MKEYVVTFLFKPNLKIIWMILKNKPKWQKGSLNGIGGKVEEMEDFDEAAVRELKEEAGVDIKKEELTRVGWIEGKGNGKDIVRVAIFTGITDKELQSMTSEQVVFIETKRIREYPYVANVPLILEACLYKLTGPKHFTEIKLKY